MYYIYTINMKNMKNTQKQKLEMITQEALKLPEYQKKQLALILIAYTLNEKSYKDSLDLFQEIAPKARIDRDKRVKEMTSKIMAK